MTSNNENFIFGIQWQSTLQRFQTEQPKNPSSRSCRHLLSFSTSHGSSRNHAKRPVSPRTPYRNSRRILKRIVCQSLHETSLLAMESSTHAKLLKTVVSNHNKGSSSFLPNADNTFLIDKPHLKTYEYSQIAYWIFPRDFFMNSASSAISMTAEVQRAVLISQQNTNSSQSCLQKS